MFELLFWVSISVISFVVIGYPLLILIICIFKSSDKKDSAKFPTVSLIIAAFNEEKIIKEKLNNTMLLDYPKEHIEIIVASDGSTDKTDSIVQEFVGRGVKLFIYERLGKTGIQNETVKKAKGEILIFSDANAMYHRDAIKKLVRNFGDENVACVCGQLNYVNPGKKASLGEKFYWQYEKILKKQESKLSSLVGVNGSIYAVRKKDFIEIDNSLISDFVLPLEIVRNKKRVIYEPEAISEEEIFASYKDEFQRKQRILIRSIQGMLYMKTLLNPFRYGIFSLQLIVHKLMRYIVPFFVLILIVSLSYLAIYPLYFYFFFILEALLIFAIIGKFTKSNSKRNLFFSLCYYYLLMNYAVIIAWIKVVKGEKIVIWQPDRK